MTVILVLLGIGSMVAGGFIGIRRLSYVTVFCISGFLALAAFRAYRISLAKAIASFGVLYGNALIISITILILLPFFTGMFLGGKVINFLGINELGSEYSSGTSAADKIFGSGFGLVVYIVALVLIS